MLLMSVIAFKITDFSPGEGSVEIFRISFTVNYILLKITDFSPGEFWGIW